jgi:hypothetical protein
MNSLCQRPFTHPSCTPASRCPPGPRSPSRPGMAGLWTTTTRGGRSGRPHALRCGPPPRPTPPPTTRRRPARGRRPGPSAQLTTPSRACGRVFGCSFPGREIRGVRARLLPTDRLPASHEEKFSPQGKTRKKTKTHAHHTTTMAQVHAAPAKPAKPDPIARTCAALLSTLFPPLPDKAAEARAAGDEAKAKFFEADAGAEPEAVALVSCGVCEQARACVPSVGQSGPRWFGRPRGNSACKIWPRAPPGQELRGGARRIGGGAPQCPTPAAQVPALLASIPRSVPKCQARRPCGLWGVAGTASLARAFFFVNARAAPFLLRRRNSRDGVGAPSLFFF